MISFPFNPNSRLDRVKKILRKVNNTFMPKIFREYPDLILDKYKIDVNSFFPRLLLLAIISCTLVGIITRLPGLPAPVTFISCAFTVYILYFRKIAWLNGRIKRERTDLERYLPLLRLEFKFLHRAMGEKQDVLKAFTSSLLNVRDKTITGIARAISLDNLKGKLLEPGFKDTRTFSTKFNQFMRRCSDSQNLQFIIDEEEAFLEYKVFLKTLETKMHLIVTGAIFLPIIAALANIFEKSLIYLNFVLLGIHFLFLRKTSKSLLKRRHALMDFDNIMNDKGNKIHLFIDFLDALSKHLKTNSPEMTVKRVIKELSKTTLEFIGLSKKKYISFHSFNDFLKRVMDEAKIDVIKMLMGVLIPLQDLAGPAFSRLVGEISQELKRQKRLHDEKKSLLQGEKMKNFVVTCIIPVMLGIMATMFPSLLPTNDFHLGPGDLINTLLLANLGMIDPLMFLLVLLGFNYLSTYYITKISGISRNHAWSIIFSIVFLIAYFMMDGYLDFGGGFY